MIGLDSISQPFINGTIGDIVMYLLICAAAWLAWAKGFNR